MKKTPLYDRHIALNARMVPFSGWSMPVQYNSIIEEHLHTRSKAGLFDICHMGEFILDTAGRDIDRVFTRSVSDMPVGKCRYGFMLNKSGGVTDDLIVFRLAEERYMLVVNAGTIDKDAGWIRKNISASARFSDVSDATAKLDVQGPSAPAVVSRLFGRPELAGLKRFNFVKEKWNGAEIIVSATGYTGEEGYELFLAADKACGLWDALLAFPDVAPVGLGARDSLRLEMGYPLYGHDIDEERTPLEAGFARFVDMKNDFIGRDKLIEREKRGFKRVLSGFICGGRRSARSGFKVFSSGKEAGLVTSGVFSPCLARGAGLCYIDREFAIDGAEILLSDGKVEIKAVLARPPFVKKK